MQHTDKCLALQKKYADAIRAWEARYPQYCHTCYGSGFLETRDSVPYGSTNVTLVGEDPCPQCVEKGICPRCGKFLIFDPDNDEREICVFCKWDEKNGDPRPPDFEGPCECEMTEIKEFQEQNIMPSNDPDWLESYLLAKEMHKEIQSDGPDNCTGQDEGN